MDKEKTDKPQQEKILSQDNVSNHVTHDLGTIFPIATQHLMINYQTAHLFNPSEVDIYPSSSSSSDSNTIYIKATNQLNNRKRTH